MFAKLILAAAVLSAAVIYRMQSQSPPPSPMEAALAAQRRLPPDAVIALQDLRLLAGVELAWFAASGSYATPAKLQASSYLSRRWPLSKAEVYQIRCDVEAGGNEFVCHADPASRDLPFLTTNKSTVVRYEYGRSPDDRSGVLP